MIEVTPDNLYKILIPLPSWEEQQRIASIPDRIDALCSDLTSGLPAEIAARQKQYEYDRDKLLAFPAKTGTGGKTYDVSVYDVERRN